MLFALFVVSHLVHGRLHLKSDMMSSAKMFFLLSSLLHVSSELQVRRQSRGSASLDCTGTHLDLICLQLRHVHCRGVVLWCLNLCLQAPRKKYLV